MKHDELTDFGDQVIALGRITGRARHTARQHDFARLDQALEAVGRRE